MGEKQASSDSFAVKMFKRTCQAGMAAIVAYTILQFLKGPSDTVANIRLASEHYARAIEPAIAGNPKFAAVQVMFGTAHEGEMIVMGPVSSTADYYELWLFIQSTRPPRPVVYSVTISPAAPGLPAVGGPALGAGATPRFSK